MVDLEFLFPGLTGTAYQITSQATGLYNCVAWAAGESGRWWWPDFDGQHFWPANVLREETLGAFQEAFESLGFVVCQSEHLEVGVEKIAVFADENGPQHVARQLPNGRWTSKLGELEDIEHDLRGLEGVAYGSVVLIMGRVAA